MTISPGLQNRTYTHTAIILHWVTAVLVLFQIPAGVLIARIELGWVYDAHKSVGILILGLAVARLLWRSVNAPPDLPPDTPLRQRQAAHAVHCLLYTLLIVQPVVGWIATSAYPAPIPFFGLFELPRIWPENRELSQQLMTLHLILGLGLGMLLVMHVGAALYHHFIRKDHILLRMLGR